MLTPLTPGSGHIIARLLPPNTLSLPTLSFQYPLKLINSSLSSPKCLTVFILSYGGGLVSNDSIDLRVDVEPAAKLCLLTQGSTKIFKQTSPSHLTTQTLTVHLSPSSSLLLLPDPLQPFADSAYLQIQRFHLPPCDTASLILLDWYTEGRSARGEQWDFTRFTSRNEIYISREPAEGSSISTERLLLRDAVDLQGRELRARMGGMKVFGTMVIRGPKFEKTAEGLLERFKKEPRMGNRNWDGELLEKRRWEGVVWTVARVRGCVIVKAGGEELEDVRGFLGSCLEEEGGDEVVGEWGRGVLMCLQ